MVASAGAAQPLPNNLLNWEINERCVPRGQDKDQHCCASCRELLAGNGDR